METAIYSPTGTPDSPPPPAYEISQDDFDQKTAQIIEDSAREPPEPRVDEDGFEIWDEDTFEAALAAMGSLSVAKGGSPESASGSQSLPSYPPEKARRQPTPQATNSPLAPGSSSAGSSSSQTRPLNLAKRARPGKERPSWHEEAGLGATTSGTLHVAPSSRAAIPFQGEALSRAGRPPRRQLTVMNRDGADPEREVTPPPEFTPVGPSLDGPPYESFTMTYDGPELEPPELLPPPAFDTLPERYSPHPPPPASPHPPPPASPQPEHVRPHPAHAQSLPSNAPPTPPSPRPYVDHAQTLPPASMSRVQPPTATSALNAYQPRAKFPGAPRLTFNPQMAYSKPLPSVPQSEEPSPQAFDASAFYNHAVAAHFSSNVPARLRQGVRQPVQSDRSSIYSQDSSWAPSANDHGSYCSPPSQAASLVASPRPSYAYGQAAFSDTTPGASDGRSQQWR